MTIFGGISRAFLAALLVAALSASGHAQSGTSSAPVVPTRAGASTTDSPVLHRVIALRFDHTPLRAALDTIALRGEIRLTYSPRHLPANDVVTLSADHITVGDAFAAVPTVGRGTCRRSSRRTWRTSRWRRGSRPG